ncbi:STAS domain-containing protein [Streptomyces sp. NPDC018038]|uniref:STAS domain-containing protein n=1 Tax=Streptomyces sp. NPDC018038 TaxID=3365036 RepID=UPI00379DE0C2
MTTRTEDEATDPGPVGTPARSSVVRVSGDLDMHHAEEVGAALARALSEAPQEAEVIIDLTYSSFCDSSGLNALLAARREALRSGRRLRLGAPSHQLVRLMESTNTVGLFAMGPTPPNSERLD